MSFLLRPAALRTPAVASRAFSATARSQLARMTVVGRLGTVPEEVTVSGDRSLIRYALATSYGKGEKQRTSWFKIASFVEGAQKDFLLNVPKGSLLYVDADARMESFTDKEGNQRSNLSLIARNFEVLSRPRNEEAADANDEGLVQDGSA